MSIEIEFKFPDWVEKVGRNTERINLFIAAQVQTNRGLLFDSEGSHNGHSKWAPLRFRQGQILSQRGTLRKSIAPSKANGTPGPDGIVQFAGDTITVGTKLLYARMMNDGTEKLPGGVLRPKNAKVLRIPLPQGKSANEHARKLSTGTAEKVISRARDGVATIEQRINATRARFSKTKSDSGSRAMAIQERLDKQLDAKHKAQAKVEKAEARRNKILATGVGGDKFIFRKWVKIPARNFDEWNQQDQQEIDGALLNLIAGILNE